MEGLIDSFFKVLAHFVSIMNLVFPKVDSPRLLLWPVAGKDEQELIAHKMKMQVI